MSGSADTMLRTAQQNIMQLSVMADQKASFVLGAALVMSTIVFGDIAGESSLDAVRLALLTTGLVSGILAAISLSPRLQTKPGKPQPLFFGSIAQLSRDEYAAMMADIVTDDERMYHVLFNDIHAASTVLVRSKYRPLQASYAVLVVGMVVTFLVVLLS